MYVCSTGQSSSSFLQNVHFSIRMAQRLMSLMKSCFGLENRLQTSLERLPEEIILKILSYLKIQELLRVSHFSKNIRRICHDKSLWKIVDLSEQKVKAKVIKAVLQNDC